MTQIPISALPTAATIQGNEPVPIVQVGSTVQTTTGAILQGLEQVSGINISAQTITASGATTARSLAAMAGDVANVLNFYESTDPDFTNAFIRAIATGKRVYVPSNGGAPYGIGSLITLPNAPVVIEGDGPETTINFVNSGQIVQNNLAIFSLSNLTVGAFTASPVIVLNFPSQPSTNYPNYHFENVLFQSTGSATLPCFVQIYNGWNSTISGCTFVAASSAMQDQVQLIGSNVNCNFINSKFFGSNSRSALAFLCNSNTIGIQGPRITDCVGTGGSGNGGNGLYFGGTSTVGIGVALISNTMFDSIPGTALYLNNCVTLLFSNCWIAASNATSAPIVVGPQASNEIVFMNCAIAPLDGNVSPYTLDGSANTGGTTFSFIGGNLQPGNTGIADNVNYNAVQLSGYGNLTLTSQNNTYEFTSVGGQANLVPAGTGNQHLALAGINGGAVNINSGAYFAGGARVADGQPFQIGNAYVSGAPTPTGYIEITDSAGVVRKVPCV